MTFRELLADVRQRAYGQPAYQAAVVAPTEGEMARDTLTLDMILEAKRKMLELAGPTPELIEDIARHGFVSWDMAQRGSDMTVAYRTEQHGGRMHVTPISMREFYAVSPYSHTESQPQVCRQCGQTADHFFTSQRDQSVLCEACFGEREAKALAKQVTKSKHPLDAWMGV